MPQWNDAHMQFAPRNRHRSSLLEYVDVRLISDRVRQLAVRVVQAGGDQSLLRGRGNVRFARR